MGLQYFKQYFIFFNLLPINDGEQLNIEKLRTGLKPKAA